MTGIDPRREVTAMLDTNPVLDFLLTRRSRPAKLLAPPGPDRGELRRLLVAALRVPDHGKLEPWRLIVLDGAAPARFAAAVRARAAETGADPEKGALAFEQAPLVVAVIGAPRESDKVPAREQVLSAGCVCLGLLNAALAAGWGANWLTGWPAYDRDLLAGDLGLQGAEWLAGFVHIGSSTALPPERPRPDVESITTWTGA